MIIVPALFEDNPIGLTQQIGRLAPHFSRIQIDVGDGVFVPRKTPPITALCDGVRAIAPHVSFDFHLMVSDVEQFFEQHGTFLTKTASRVLIHFEARWGGLFTHSASYPFSLGLVLSPDTPTSVLYDGDPTPVPSLIQIMTVYPGLQGQNIIEKSLIKVDQLRRRGYSGEILVDGGINEKTLTQITSLPSLPDVLCVGSALVTTNNVAETKKRLYSLI